MSFNYEELAGVAFNIIIHAGNAKSSAMEGVYAAKEGNFKLAKEKIEESHKEMIEAEKQHTPLIQAEAQGTKVDIPLLLMHAEDQMLTTQTLILMAEEIIHLHEVVAKK